MDKRRQWVVIAAVAAIAVLAAGWLLLISPKRAEAGDLRGQAETAASATMSQRNQLAVLREQAKGLPEEQKKIAAVEAQIPDDPALPPLIRALSAAASASEVALVSITPAVPVAVDATKAAGTATGTTPTTTPAAGSSTATSPGSATAAGQLTSIDVTVVVYGGYFQSELYLAALEDLSRAFRVRTVSMRPAQDPTRKAAAGAVSTLDGSKMSTTITGQVFLAAGRPKDVAVTVPDTAAAAATATAPTAN